MAGKTRSSGMAEDTAASFAKHMDNYIKNSEVFKHSMVAAAQAAVLLLKREISRSMNVIHFRGVSTRKASVQFLYIVNNVYFNICCKCLKGLS